MSKNLPLHETVLQALVIDDDDLMRMMLKEALTPLGLKVIEAADGVAGIELFTANSPDLVMLDLLMPGLDGVEVCRRLRALPDAQIVPIVMMTGQDDRSSIDHCFAAGATDFIAKPIAWPLLPHRVRFLLQAAKTLRNLVQSDARLREAQRLAGLGSFEYLVDKRYFYPSSNLAQLLGMPGDENSRLRDLKLAFSDAEQQHIQQLAEEATKTGRVQVAEVWTVNQRCLRLQIEAAHERGEPLLRGSLLDVTDLRSSETQSEWLVRHGAAAVLHEKPEEATGAVAEAEAPAKAPESPPPPAAVAASARHGWTAHPLAGLRRLLGSTTVEGTAAARPGRAGMPAEAASSAGSELLPLVDPAPVQRLLDSFPTRPSPGFLPRMLATFRQVLDGNLGTAGGTDFEAVRRAAYTIRSASAQVGAMRLSDHARRLETAAGRGEIELTAELAEELGPLAEQSWQALQEHYQG